MGWSVGLAYVVRCAGRQKRKFQRWSIMMLSVHWSNYFTKNVLTWRLKFWTLSQYRENHFCHILCGIILLQDHIFKRNFRLQHSWGDCRWLNRQLCVAAAADVADDLPSTDRKPLFLQHCDLSQYKQKQLITMFAQRGPVVNVFCMHTAF